MDTVLAAFLLLMFIGQGSAATLEFAGIRASG